MDTAFELKIASDNGHFLSDNEILEKLRYSDLVRRLTTSIPEKPLAIVWRLICLSEIPFSSRLDYTQKLIEKAYSKFSTPFGFSLSGNEKMFLPCYNAMIVSALCRLGRANDQEVLNAVEWINSNQPMERGKKVNLSNFNFQRYGGCFEKTPCYIGLAKSVFALQDFKEKTEKNKYDAKLQKGITYILQHKFFKRLSKDEPINKHITDISFPETYHLNVVELLLFAKKAGLLDEDKTKDLKLHIKKRMTKDGHWKNNFTYKAEGYTTFDKGKEKSEWTTYIIKQAFDNRSNHKHTAS